MRLIAGAAAAAEEEEVLNRLTVRKEEDDNDGSGAERETHLRKQTQTNKQKGNVRIIIILLPLLKMYLQYLPNRVFCGRAASGDKTGEEEAGCSKNKILPLPLVHPKNKQKMPTLPSAS